MNWKKEINKISNWIKEYVEKAGLKGIVCGLSGGIDSSVAICLAIKAIGEKNVIGVSMPCESSEDSIIDAQQLAKNLNIKFYTIPLENSFNSVLNGITQTTEKNNIISKLTKANIKARLRMVTLYAVANQHNYLVIGTSNKSEIECGYFTKFGDGGVDIEPLGEYYKGEVYQMAELFSEIPESIKTKAPSADLYDGQTDEQELGMPYEKIDNILRGIEGNRECLDKADIKDIEKVQYLQRISIHKNNIPPRFERK